MPLISLNDVHLTFAGPAILDGANLQIDDGERLGLLGRNGAGKTSLLRLLEGTLAPDSGDIVRAPGLRVASLPQDVPLGLTGSVHDFLRDACGVHVTEGAWRVEGRIDQAARDLGLDLAAGLETLSAGARRRVLLAAALAHDANLLLLDEPTNHLDIDAIDFLEETLQRRKGALVFVTHDRDFLRHVATRIVDLDRGAIRSYGAGYDDYLARRDELLRVEAEQAARFDKKLAQEEAWVRRGVKARRTRNEGRVRELEALRNERAARRDEVGRVRATLQEAGRSGQVVLRSKEVTFAHGGAPIVRGYTGTIARGDRVGILGPNGCGKTTLIKLLLGELTPQAGTVTAGTRLEVAHFEQLHDVLDPAKTVFENVGDGRDTVDVGGVERHVVGYLRDFLFTQEQIQGPITRLSGGERRRLQLAKVLSRPNNLLVLDEPTNDLDLETLELLEDLLLDYQGTLLVVSHDRAFLDNVVSSTLVSEGAGRWGEYTGGYSDWARQAKAAKAAQTTPRAPTSTRARNASPGARPRKFAFKEKRELAEMPARIEQLEADKHALFDAMAAPNFYQTPAEEIARTRERLAALEATIHAAYARWAELESLAAAEVNED
jgi:ATP-binding cassette subfamily F protein uup